MSGPVRPLADCHYAREHPEHPHWIHYNPAEWLSALPGGTPIIDALFLTVPPFDLWAPENAWIIKRAMHRAEYVYVRRKSGEWTVYGPERIDRVIGPENQLPDLGEACLIAELWPVESGFASDAYAAGHSYIGVSDRPDPEYGTAVSRLHLAFCARKRLTPSPPPC